MYNRARLIKVTPARMGPMVLPPTDAELVADIQNGRTESETALYEKYSRKVYYLALRESKSTHDAEDVCAETFLRVLQAIREDRIRSAFALAAFVFGVTRNVLLELHARRGQTQDEISPDSAGLATPSHERIFLTEEVCHAVRKIIERLKTRERTILRLCFYEELPTEEIARQIGIAPERVRLVKSRALKRFRDIYKRLDTTGEKDS